MNTLQPFDPPHNEMKPTLPPQDMATIGDELSDKGSQLGLVCRRLGGRRRRSRSDKIFNSTISPSPISGNTHQGQTDGAII